MEVVTQDKITPSLYREVVGLVVRLREQKISMERLRLERARFELDVADLVMKHIRQTQILRRSPDRRSRRSCQKDPGTHVRQIHQGAARGRRIGYELIHSRGQRFYRRIDMIL